ncbi:predicted protein [Chaetomium globosum CBS 148.51]|uniref:Uncharacterized protein n=1 Tax=Chaetomium globosum (strain ATCC 6205 / CBS 148.51 / DSM 1962 / NBRC 6347 / NRRL 1970) TaxID=306901 RepID=Q2H6L0_CHAGB|nr:uncharacterized protein CHGG_05705 [Chaetomium globosum CBS 148.51]EAQ89086.1 predicted protein [Chaetomium globosum CBS 148.51]
MFRQLVWHMCWQVGAGLHWLAFWKTIVPGWSRPVSGLTGNHGWLSFTSR